MPKHLPILPAISAVALLLAVPAASSANDGIHARSHQLAQAAKANKVGKSKKAKKPRVSRRTQRFMRLYDLNGDGKVDIGELRGRRGRDDSAGLGLTVSQRVAEAHGGEIGAYNLDSGGAAVWFSVPLVQGK